MLMMKERRPAFRTIEGWARSILIEAGAIRECKRALLVARQEPPPGVSPDEAAAAVDGVLGSIGDTCPECPPEE